MTGSEENQFFLKDKKDLFKFWRKRVCFQSVLHIKKKNFLTIEWVGKFVNFLRNRSVMEFWMSGSLQTLKSFVTESILTLHYTATNTQGPHLTPPPITVSVGVQVFPIITGPREILLWWSQGWGCSLPLPFPLPMFLDKLLCFYN